MQNTCQFEMTWVQRFLNSSSSLAIAHKLGWDNMSLAWENLRVVEILWSKWITQNFSVSAFRSSKMDFNTTSKLIQAWESWNLDTIWGTLLEIQEFHTKLLEDILSRCSSKIKADLLDYAKWLFQEYQNKLKDSDLSRCQKISDYIVWVWESAYSLLSVWEVIAAKVFTLFLQKHWIPAVYVDTPWLKDINLQILNEKVRNFLMKEFTQIYAWNSKAIPIIPGYIGGIEWWILPRLDRWYTDFTGERAAVSLHEMWSYNQVIFYIQKMYGFKSTDPRWLEDPWSAKSINELSYSLTRRAISQYWAGAWLINSDALSADIIKRKISLLVGNPTDNTDIAHISEKWNTWKNSVELVLWRDYNASLDDASYNRERHQTSGSNIVYLMWENIEKLWEVYMRANRVLKQHCITPIAWNLLMGWHPEASYVFWNRKDAQKARSLLHDEFI